ncbi:DUF3817 domain-containing protein [Acidovorax sp. SUPP2539]|uniref:DUF3817 domain-containing protein n=1 Tax=Acidovorax sp. SUPP2539 TaxID=2920878 RepID=UPI0024E180B2|nr:DUF3817 domain-containing protein [Acidovorax sp. SUPP2539]
MTHHDPAPDSCARPDGPAHGVAALRTWCVLEATTLLALLLVAVPLKHLGGFPMAVSVMGPIHGFAFLALGWAAVRAVASGGLSKQAAGKLMLAACLPFGGLYSRWVLR